VNRIAVLIPAYKTGYLKPLFESLRRQTFRDFRVLLSDDSPDATITRSLREGRFDDELAGLHLTVVRGPCSGLKNHRHVLHAWNRSTPLVHMLMDDDVIDPEFYAHHVAVHDAVPAVSVSVSLRRLIRASGEAMGMLPLPDFITAAMDETVLVNAATLVRSTVLPSQNWLGELSNMVLGAQAACRFPAPPAAGPSYFGLPDIGLLLDAKDIGPIAVVRRALGGFRQHPDQSTGNVNSLSLKIAHLAWVSFALRARQERHLNDDETRTAIALAIRRCLGVYGADSTMRPFYELVRDNLMDLDLLEGAFSAAWGALLDANADTRRADWGVRIDVSAATPNNSRDVASIERHLVAQP
jgi:glycosyltransferase involved in cell wall biosynthesis